MVQNITKAAKKLTVLLIVFIVIQLLFTAALNVYAKPFLLGFDMSEDGIHIAIICINIFLALAYLAADVSIISRIVRTRALLKAEPVRCILESYAVTKYISDGKPRYNVDLIVRRCDNGELYFSYGKHNRSFYDFVHSSSHRSLSGIAIFRKDGSSVNEGDVVTMYHLKDVPVKVKISDREKVVLKLNGKVMRFSYLNEKFNPDSFCDFRYYEGAVDVEAV